MFGIYASHHLSIGNKHTSEIQPNLKTKHTTANLILKRNTPSIYCLGMAFPLNDTLIFSTLLKSYNSGCLSLIDQVVKGVGSK